MWTLEEEALADLGATLVMLAVASVKLAVDSVKLAVTAAMLVVTDEEAMLRKALWVAESNKHDLAHRRIFSE